MSNVSNYGNPSTYLYTRTPASSVSGASMASGIVSRAVESASCAKDGEITIDKLSLDEVMDSFSKGNLTVGEMEKWLQSKGATYEFTETSSTVNFKFTLNGKDYGVGCTKEAAASQTDNITIQFTYSESYIKSLKLTEPQLERYFIVVKTDSNGRNTYAINPDCGLNSYSDIKNAAKEINKLINDMDGHTVNWLSDFQANNPEFKELAIICDKYNKKIPGTIRIDIVDGKPSLYINEDQFKQIFEDIQIFDDDGKTIGFTPDSALGLTRYQLNIIINKIEKTGYFEVMGAYNDSLEKAKNNPNNQ